MLFLLIAISVSIATGDTEPRLLRPSVASWRHQMLQELNDLRAKYKKPSVGMNVCVKNQSFYYDNYLIFIIRKLETAAQKHATFMAQAKIMSHTGAGGSSFSDRIAAEKFEIRSAAENVAQGQGTVVAVMESWRTSQGHFMNMIGDYACVGFGVEYDSDGSPYWCQDFGKNDVDICVPPNGSGNVQPVPPVVAPPPTNNVPPPPQTPPPPSKGTFPPPNTPTPPRQSPPPPQPPSSPTVSPTIQKPPSPPKSSASPSPLSKSPPSTPSPTSFSFGWSWNSYTNPSPRAAISSTPPSSWFGSRPSKEFTSSEMNPGISPQSFNENGNYESDIENGEDFSIGKVESSEYIDPEPPSQSNLDLDDDNFDFRYVL